MDKKHRSLYPLGLLLFFLLALAGCGSQYQKAAGPAVGLTAGNQSSSGEQEDYASDDPSGQADGPAAASAVRKASDLARSRIFQEESQNPQDPGGQSGGAGEGSEQPGNSGGSSGSSGNSGGSSGSSGSAAAPSAAGSLHVSGTQLCDSAGNPVQLRGISTHGLAWFPDYVNENCFADFKNNWNANVIRLAMYTAEYGGYCSGGDTAYLKDLVRSGIRYAASQDLYVIVDWHILSDGNPNSHLAEAKDFFHEISSEFSGSGHILYEICNEPNGGTSWSQIKSYALEVIPVIRANDPDAVIIVGTPNWSQYVDQAAADPITEYDNLMYALHYYAATHKEDLRNKMTSALSSGLPIFVSEYGICDASGNGGLDIDQANLWVDTMDQWGVSYVAWNLSNKNESSAILQSSCSKTSGFTQEDLSDSGKWLYEMLTGRSGGPAPAPGNTSPENVPAASITPPAASTPPPEADTSGTAPSPPENNAAGTPPPAPESNAAITNGNGIQVTATVINSWENGGLPYYQYSLTLKNTTGQNCGSWTIHLPCENGMSLSDSWNGEYAISGGQLTISNKDYNGAIPAGGTIDNIGFIVYGGKLQ